MEKAKEILVLTLAIVIIMCFMALLALLIFQEVPKPNSDLLYIMVGVFGTMAVTVINFYFGSSNGSKDKTKMLNGKTD